MKRNKLTLVVLIILSTLILASCGNSLIGTKWINIPDSEDIDPIGFEITDTAPPVFRLYMATDNATLLAGNIVSEPNFTDETGFLNIQITESLFETSVGQYTRIHWRNFTKESCDIQDAAGWAATEAEAEEKFTYETGFFTVEDHGSFTKVE